MIEGQHIRVLVCGGRNYADSARMAAVLARLHGKYPIDVVIHGAARGADELAGRWAASNGIACDAYLADWDRHGKSAGMIRNTTMLREGKPDCVVAFPGGAGTAHMVRISRAAGLSVWVIE